MGVSLSRARPDARRAAVAHARPAGAWAARDGSALHRRARRALHGLAGDHRARRPRRFAPARDGPRRHAGPRREDRARLARHPRPRHRADPRGPRGPSRERHRRGSRVHGGARRAGRRAGGEVHREEAQGIALGRAREHRAHARAADGAAPLDRHGPPAHARDAHRHGHPRGNAAARGAPRERLAHLARPRLAQRVGSDELASEFSALLAWRDALYLAAR
jgi:hypothetical protein